MVDAGNLGDVVDVIDQHAERRTRYFCRVGFLNLFLQLIGDGLAFRLELRLGLRDGLADRGFLRFRCQAILIAEKAGVKVHHHNAPVLADGAEHVVVHVARRIAQSTSGGMGRNHRSTTDDQRAVKRLVGNVRDIHHHAQAIHLVNDILAEITEAVFGVGNGRIVDIAGRVGPAVGV